MIKFYTIKDFACKHFFAWEDGKDFLWLKKEWNKFCDNFNTQKQAIDFIKCLSDIYDIFCHAAYFESNDSEYALEHAEHPYMSKTQDILLEIYQRPEDIYREFASIKIDWQMPHQDGRKFILKLFEMKWQLIIDDYNQRSSNEDKCF